MPLPISSVETAALSMWNSSSMPRWRTISFKINSAIGERQMLPWQTNNIFVLSLIDTFFIVSFS